MVKIKIYGNAFAHRFAYEQGQHLVSPEIAKKLVDLGVAEILSSDVETATTATKVETAVTKPKKQLGKKK